jgi:hypothetical protein
MNYGQRQAKLSVAIAAALRQVAAATGDKGGTSSAAQKEDWGFSGTVKMLPGGLWEGNRGRWFEGKDDSIPSERGPGSTWALGVGIRQGLAMWD